MNKIEIPNNVKFIMGILNHNGFEAFVVGGAIRDGVLGLPINDWDIATNALPEQVTMFFKNMYGVKIVPTGIKHGTVTIFIDNEDGVEVTTYRKEFNFDGHDCDVEFVTTIEEDLARRDFTINAIAMDYNNIFVDPFGGIKDINRGKIRFVGNPEQRIKEDPLRMMRAIRFKAQKNFEIEEDAWDAIVKNSFMLGRISKERIAMELEKIIVANPQMIFELITSGLMNRIIPEISSLAKTTQINPYHSSELVINHTVDAMGYIDNSFILRMTMLLHDVGKQYTKTTDDWGIDHFYGHEEYSARVTEEVLRNLKLDNDTIKNIKILVKNHGLQVSPNKKSVKRVMNKVGKEYFFDLIRVKCADDLAKDQNNSNVVERINNVDKIIDIFNQVMNEDEAFDVSGLAVNGYDMIDIGFVGREIGEILDYLVNVVIDNPETNKKDVLISIAKERR